MESSPAKPFGLLAREAGQHREIDHRLEGADSSDGEEGAQNAPEVGETATSAATPFGLSKYNGTSGMTQFRL